MWNSQGVDNAEAQPEPVVVEAQTREPMNKALLARLVLGAVIVAAFVIFALQNTESATIEFLSWSGELSQFLLMVLSAVAGVVIWSLAGFISRRTRDS